MSKRAIPAKRSRRPEWKRGLAGRQKVDPIPADATTALRLRVEKRIRLATKAKANEARNLQRQPQSPGNVDGIIAKLPLMQPDQLVRIWKNAIRLLTKASATKPPAGPIKMLNAVEAEWRNRGLKRLNADEFFNWPTTDANGGDHSLSFAGKTDEGMLSYLEYRVGKTNGEPAPVRHAILDRVFGAFLPPVFPKDYMDAWGIPKSAARLKKMAESLAAFTRNAKRRDPNLLDEAIRQWEADLEHLHEKYYVGRFHFGWPTATLAY
ncbi:MAG: hypothetical protein WC889_01480 [Myxococcota bacterium]